MQNVSETCKVGGYFIGTCLDGEKIFKLLEHKTKEDSHIIKKDGEIMWEAQKIYDTKIFEAQETSLGLAVGIFQESIGKMVEEYLVHFDYLCKLLENYGFQLASSEDVSRWELPNHSGSFGDLFNQMDQQIENGMLKPNKVKTAPQMTEEEKELSFMTRYFIFEKKLAVNAKEVYISFIGSE